MTSQTIGTTRNYRPLQNKLKLTKSIDITTSDIPLKIIKTEEQKSKGDAALEIRLEYFQMRVVFGYI